MEQPKSKLVSHSLWTERDEMRQNLRLHAKGSQRFRQVLRSASDVSAVVHRTENGLLIELSNGRVCSMSRDAFGPATNALTAAVQWARRNGATSVEISD